LDRYPKPEEFPTKAPEPSAAAEARMRALHRAALSLYADLSLDGVLQRITQAAKELSAARYAALGIPDQQGGLQTFITLGMGEEEARGIPHRPLARA
jgi:hypothetical protein